MSLSPVEQIKSRLDVADVVGGYVRLNKAGINMKGLCPFHQEKTPSFFVSPARQTYHCFGCNKGGDIFSFMQEIEGWTFPEALKTLAQRAGVEIKNERPEKTEKRSRLFEINELSAKFYEVQIKKGVAGKKANEYMLKRGLKSETLEAFRVGWAPAQDTALLKFLKAKGYSEEEIIEAGLALRSRDAVRDRFRGRIMFPIMDGNDRVVGFTGRIFGREEEQYDPKYMNTPETPTFEKRRILYGLNRARRAMRAGGKAVLVEGQMDALMAHQVGTEHTVATSGTALTEDHIKQLKRLCDTLVVAYDSDEAGVESTDRSIDMALEAELMVEVAQVPKGKDPADLILEDAKAWEELLLNGTQPVTLFRIEKAIATHGTETAQAKRAVVEAVLRTVSRMSNAIDRGKWIGEAAYRIGIKEELLWQELEKFIKNTPIVAEVGATNGADKEARAQASEALSRREFLEQHLLVSILVSGSSASEVKDLFTVESLKVLFDSVKSDSSDLSERLKLFTEASETEHRALAETIALKAEALKESLEDAEEEFIAACREIRKHDVRERLDSLSIELEHAERSGDEAKIRALTEKFKEHSANLSSLMT